VSEEKEAIQKLYKWHDSFAASPPDTPMQAVDGIIHSCQSWRDKVTELESRIENAVGLLKEVRQWHSDPSLPEYNHCDTAPCHFCEQAAEIILDGK